MSIEISHISKSYGSQKVLDDISFSVAKGEIVGFLGPNGAGKSTLMKILTTYISADKGVAMVNGFDVASATRAVQRSIGYLPEHNPLYHDLYAREYLAFNADVYGVPKSRIDDVITLTGLLPESGKKIGQLSKGYRQRVGLANALLHDPEVLILDEPTTGLDPNQLIGIRDVIKNAGKNKTILLSTHILQEVEAICDRILIIDQGKIVTDNKLEHLSEQYHQIIEVEFDASADIRKIGTLTDLTLSKNISGNLWELTFSSDADRRPTIFDFAQENNLRILQMSLKNRSLESVFRDVTK